MQLIPLKIATLRALFITVSALSTSTGLAWEYHPEIGNPLHTTYTVEDHGGGDWNNQITSDRFGNTFVANEKGLLKFDGESWARLPETGYANYTTGVAIDTQNRIWICGANHVGYYTADSTGSYAYTDLTESVDALPERDQLGLFWRLWTDDEQAYLITSFYVLRWDGTKWSKWAFETERRILHSMLDGKLYIHSRGEGFYRFDGNDFDLLSNDEQLCSSGIISILADTPKGLLCATVSEGLVTFQNGVFTPFPTSIDASLKKMATYLAAMLPPHCIVLGTDNGTFFIDKDGKQISRLKQISSVAHYIHLDSLNTVWIGELSAIRRVSNPAVSFYESNVVDDITRYKDKLYLARRTEIQILQQRRSEELEHQFNTLDTVSHAFRTVEIDGHLFYGGHENIGIANENGVIRNIQHPRYVEWLKPSMYSTSTVYLADSPYFSRLQKNGPTWELYDTLKDLSGSISSIAELSDQNILICVHGSSLNQIRWPTDKDKEAEITAWGEKQGLPESFDWSYLLQSQDDILLITNDGLYRYDTKESRFSFDPVFGKSLGNDAYTLESAPLAGGRGWILNLPVVNKQSTKSKSRIGILQIEDDSLEWEPMQLPAIDQVGTIESLLHEEEDSLEILWVGGTKGLLRYDLGALVIPPVMPVRLTSVNELTTQTTYYGGAGNYPGTNLWKYPQNSLEFEFAASPHPLESTGYQSRLLGFESDWLATTTRNFREYTNLNEGNYSFEVKAIDELGRAGPVTSFSFTILPPWYRTPYAYFAYIIGLASIIMAIARWWTKRLRRRNIELEMMVNQRTSELERSNQKLRQANAVKQDFLASMSHEIRNPLNGILGIARLMRDQAEHSNQDDERLQHLFNCATHLHQLLGEVLDYSSLEAGKLSAKRVSFNPLNLTDEVCSMHRAIAENKGLELTIDLPELMHEWMGDPVLLRQILINLVSNAIKYTPEGRIAVRLECEGSAAVFSVSDTGPGIPEEKQQEIFEKFTRLSKAGESQIAGTGLGLAIASQMAVLLGGELLLDSDFTQGARFCLRLRVEQSERKIESTSQTNSPFSRPFLSMRVLVADDMDFNRYINSELLNQMGAKTRTANCGKAALDELVDGSFDFALLDINMPDMTGIDVVRHYLRSSPIHPAKLIALSAHSTERMQGDCLEAGFDYFIEKPLEPEKLTKLIAPKAAPKQAPSGSLLDYLANQDPGAMQRLEQRFIASIQSELHVLREATEKKREEAQTASLHKIKGLIALRQNDEMSNAFTSLESSLKATSDSTKALTAIAHFTSIVLPDTEKC